MPDGILSSPIPLASDPLGSVAPAAQSSSAIPIGGQALLLAAPAAAASCSIPFGGSSMMGVHDFGAVIGPSSTYYAMEILGDPVARIPISSWQCTYRSGNKTFLQAVIPAVSPWIQLISERRNNAEFRILRGARLPAGDEIEYEMARAPLAIPQYNRGPYRWTCIIRGYADAFVPGDAELLAPPRVLRDVRSVMVVNNLRVRCGVDWLLRPGGRAVANGQEFTVDYINYIVGGNDAYMDVGAAAAESE